MTDWKYINNPSRALEVTLCSSTDTNLGHIHTEIEKNVLGTFELHFLGE